MKLPRSLKARALQLLAQREQSRVELRRKLLAYANVHATGHPTVRPKAIDDVDAEEAEVRVDALLDWLESQRFLSAERFVESRVRARLVRFGNLRVQQELRHHGLVLDPETSFALAQSELERARGACARKFPNPPRDVAQRARLGRFLTGRGFSADVVRRVVREMGIGSTESGLADHSDRNIEPQSPG